MSAPYAMMHGLIFRPQSEHPVTDEEEAQTAIHLLFGPEKQVYPLDPEAGMWTVKVTSMELEAYGWRDRERGLIGFGGDDSEFVFAVPVGGA